MGYSKQITVSIIRSSSRTPTEIELSGSVTQGPANTIDRRVNFRIPNDDVQYAVRALAMWASRPQDSSAYSTSFDQDKLSAAWLRELANSLDPQ